MHVAFSAELIRGTGLRHPPRPNPWVARIVGTDSHWGLKRVFVKGVYDYTYARKSGGRGTFVYWFLSPGIYEVFYPTSWNPNRDVRQFIYVGEDGTIKTIERGEVVECLKNACLE